MRADIFAPAPVAESSALAAQQRWLNGSREGQPDGLHRGLHTPAVRDLAWLMTSSPLLSRAAFGTRLADPFDEVVFGTDARQRMHRLLQRLDTAPQALIDALAVTDERRLGRYAERLLAVWLDQSDGIDLTAIGLPVRDIQGGGRTLGECDALFRTASGSSEHWELAVKFFLFIDDDCRAGVPAAPFPASRPDDSLDTLLAGCDAYVGAGLADRFDWKLRRLIAHQLPLSAHPALLAMAPGPWQARMFVKGRLFYPLAHWDDPPASAARHSAVHDVRSPVDVPVGNHAGASADAASCDSAVGQMTAIAADHPRGWWATLDTWLAWSEASACRWTTLARLDWLAPLRAQAHRTRDAKAFAEEMSAHFASGMPSASMPRQVAALSPAPVGAMPDMMQVEMSRGFIVPNEWPERARRFRRSGV